MQNAIYLCKVGQPQNIVIEIVLLTILLSYRKISPIETLEICSLKRNNCADFENMFSFNRLSLFKTQKYTSYKKLKRKEKCW